MHGVLAVLVLAAGVASAGEELFPDVLRVDVRARNAACFDFFVTISSPYDSARRYADGFQVSDGRGRIFGEKTLWHHHGNEQPFTRALTCVKIPPPTAQVVVQARDQVSGYGGAKVAADLPGRATPPAAGKSTDGNPVSEDAEKPQ